MNLNMDISKLGYCIKVAACICGKDGVISQLEELSIFKLINERYPTYSDENIELALDEFFDSNQQIEDYLAKIDDVQLREFTLELAEISAGADELDVNENIALDKAYLIWGIVRYV